MRKHIFKCSLCGATLMEYGNTRLDAVTAANEAFPDWEITENGAICPNCRKAVDKKIKAKIGEQESERDLPLLEDEEEPDPWPDNHITKVGGLGIILPSMDEQEPEPEPEPDPKPKKKVSKR